MPPVVKLRRGYTLLVARQYVQALERLDGYARATEFATADALGWSAVKYLERKRERLAFGEFVKDWAELPLPESEA